MRFLTSLILVVLFSFSVLAIPPPVAPGELFSDVGSFFVSLMTGSPDFTSAYFLVLLLYFTIFISLFVEGVKKIPLFGGKDEINTPGKWFATAIAFLSTMGVFMLERNSQKSGAELIASLISPFAIYAGVALAGILAYIAFRVVKDSKVFEDDIIIPMAFALALAVTIAGYLLSSDRVFGWGYVIMLIVFIIGFILKWAEDDGGADKAPKPSKPDAKPTSKPIPSKKKPGKTPKGSDDDRPPAGIPPPTPASRYRPDPPTPNPPLDNLPPKPIGPEPKKKKKQRLPKDEKHFKDLSEYFGSIRSQDGLGACGGFAAAACAEYVVRRQTGKQVYFSPLYLYYVARLPTGDSEGLKSTDEGTCPYVLVDWLKKKGICFEQFWRFEPKMTGKWQREPSAQAKNDATTKQVVNTYILSKTDFEQWAYEICKNENPILLGIKWPRDFGGGFNRSLYANPNPELTGGHGVVVVGYHSHYPHQGKGVRAFKIRNSWNVTWGENGYAWITEEALRACMEKSLWEPIVIRGWKGSAKEQTCRITGRVVIDSPQKKIDENLTGEQIVHSREIRSPPPGYKVGAMVRIGKKNVTLKEVVVTDSRGTFVLDFTANPAAFSKFTKMPLRVDPSKSIDLRSLPAGVLVYKEGLNSHEEGIFGHAMDIRYSRAGRGGEGRAHPDNPNSTFLHGGSITGRPIVFSPEHLQEDNVVIPFRPKQTIGSKEIDNSLEKIKKYAQKESKWLAAEYNALEEAKKDLKDDGHTHPGPLRDVGRAERYVQRFEKKLEKRLAKIDTELASEFSKHVETAPQSHQKHLQKYLTELQALSKELLKFTSRGEGSLRQQLNKLKVAEKSGPEGKAQELHDKLAKDIDYVTKLTHGLQVKLKELLDIDNLESFIKKWEPIIKQ